jgi:dihydrofolate synthase/folylpolyglutamate synthase
VDFVLDNLTLHVPLPGRHQVDNAALAVTAVRQTKELLIDGGAIARGLANVQWPGRFEIARRDPPLIFDCAHNADSAQKLVAALSNYFPDRHWMLIFGASSDKDIAGMLDALLPIADRVIVTRAKSARAADLESIAQRVAERHRSVEIASDVRGAIDLTVDTHAPIVVAGSIFVAAEAREAWFAHIGAPLPETDDQ